MFNKKKLNFWRLVFIFSGIVIIALFFEWTSPQKEKASMMTQSMGNTAKGMHLSNPTIYDLLGKPEMSQQARDMSSHHPDEPTNIERMGVLTTIIIFGLLPFIIGGAVVLAIVWIK